MTYRKALTPRALPIPTEHAEQVALFEWAATQKVHHPELLRLYSIPNAGGYRGGFRNNVVRVRWMLAEGVKPGYPDVGLDVARGGFHGVRVEMKRRRDSRFSEEQADWRTWLLSQGYQHHLAFGWNQAAEALLNYLALPSHSLP